MFVSDENVLHFQIVVDESEGMELFKLLNEFDSKLTHSLEAECFASLDDKVL